MDGILIVQPLAPAIVWFWMSLRPDNAYLKREGRASEATKMCIHIFCRLCIMCVQAVWQPIRNEISPANITIRAKTAKKIANLSIFVLSLKGL